MSGRMTPARAQMGVTDWRFGRRRVDRADGADGIRVPRKSTFKPRQPYECCIPLKRAVAEVPTEHSVPLRPAELPDKPSPEVPVGRPLDDELVAVRPASPALEFTIPQEPTPERPIALDMTRVSRTQRETAMVAAILHEVFANDETDTTHPAPPAASASAVTGTASAAPFRERAFWRALGERDQWTRVEVERLAAHFNMMPDGAIEHINEAAFDRFGHPVCEGDDPIVVETSLLKEMLV